MMTKEQVRAANLLLAEHERIAKQNWNCTAFIMGGHSREGTEPEAADPELQEAIEAFKRRKLAAIEADLRELGVEPPEAA
jgi:hypothetical protein